MAVTYTTAAEVASLIRTPCFTACTTPCCGLFDVACETNTDAATNLATAISCDCRTPACGTITTHDTSAAGVGAVVTITADNGEIGGCITLVSSSATRLLTSGTTLTGGQGREIIDLKLIGMCSGEISMNFINTPMADGIFLESIGCGTSGRLAIVYE